MFKDLHVLAKEATLMIIATAEADQLRVSVTPTYPGGKAPAHPMRPLSVIGTPEELDADFAGALAIWRAPKRTVLEQAQDAADHDGDDESVKHGAKPAPTKPKGTPGRKSKAAAGAPEEQSDPAAPLPAAAQNAIADAAAQLADTSGAGAEQGKPSSENAAAAEPAGEAPPAAAPVAGDPAVDTVTLDLF